MITLIAPVRVSREAFEKLTTMRVVADDDWITEVIRNPVRMPLGRLEVIVARIARIRSPARSIRASLMTFIPKRKRPKAPISCRISPIPYSISTPREGF
jgi:hypothetical protein